MVIKKKVEYVFSLSLLLIGSAFLILGYNDLSKVTPPQLVECNLSDLKYSFYGNIKKDFGLTTLIFGVIYLVKIIFIKKDR